MHRVLGCTANYRAPDGPIRFFEDEMVLRENYNRIIVQLTGVDSLVDDPEVQAAQDDALLPRDCPFCHIKP